MKVFSIRSAEKYFEFLDEYRRAYADLKESQITTRIDDDVRNIRIATVENNNRKRLVNVGRTKETYKYKDIYGNDRILETELDEEELSDAALENRMRCVAAYQAAKERADARPWYSKVFLFLRSLFIHNSLSEMKDNVKLGLGIRDEEDDKLDEMMEIAQNTERNRAKIEERIAQENELAENMERLKEPANETEARPIKLNDEIFEEPQKEDVKIEDQKEEQGPENDLQEHKEEEHKL